MKTRRDVLMAGGAGVCLLAVPPRLFAQQQGKVWRIGILSLRPISAGALHGTFVQGMHELGYVEGKNLVMEWRFADGSPDRYPTLAAELARLRVDVMVVNGTPATEAARKATADIPIVMIGVGDPVSSGVIKSLARPGGNVTGLSSITSDLGQKHLEMLLSVAAKDMRAAVLVDPRNSAHSAILRNVRDAARTVGVTVLPLEARNAEEIAQALSMAGRKNVKAVIVNGGIFNRNLRQIAELAQKHKMVSISAFEEYVTAGGLMSYGQNLADSYRRAAYYVDRILKGTKPADLPVEQPTKFELVVNMKTAKALGVTIPQTVLVRATKVIE